MKGSLTLETTVAYADVDRGEMMLLARWFKLLQEAAILHANQYGAGTNAVATRSETWVLNRIATEIARYPRAGEKLVVETWSTGIRSFKGYRDFRVFDHDHRQILTGSSFWIYLNAATKTIVRVPRDIAESFPVGAEPPWRPDLEQAEVEPPSSAAAVVPITLRYSDHDVNEHMNNAAYLDLIQTALAASGASPHPRSVNVHYRKAIPAALDRVDLRVDTAGGITRLEVQRDGRVFASAQTG
ncbi:MAG TPA: acyl-ACP thioesterase domain-containing protein [Opitutaceae bacterium]|nr:acyl-ACP thioesterase domain-containing protein [Opitutaceae bacterium]